MAAVLLVTFSIQGQSQDNPPQTPLGILARSAGAFLGSLEYMRVFKSSDCGYALKKTYPSLDQTLVGEVLPAFPPGEARDGMAKSIQENRSALSQQANIFVGQILAAAKQDHDRNTACGFIAGTLAGVSGRAYDGWSANKMQYGWKGR